MSALLLLDVRPAGRTCSIVRRRRPPSLLHTRQGEVLAGRQGCPSRGGIRRKPQAKRWLDEQEPHTRHRHRMRVQMLSKSDTCTEGVDVYAAGISVKAGAYYPGRSGRLL